MSCVLKHGFGPLLNRGFLVDNLEGMSLVPIKDSNKKLLILVSDNNFNILQNSQFLFFEVFKK